LRLSATKCHDGKVELFINSLVSWNGKSIAIVSVGIDLAKNVFAVHGVDASGKPALVRTSVPRARLLELIAAPPACLIGMEACSGAHLWVREFQMVGHAIRLMAPNFVIPYVRSSLVMGARAVLAPAMNEANPRQDPASHWARALAERRGYWRAVVAVAAKNARMCWAALQRGDPISRWVHQLREKHGWQKAAVALANKNARILWAVMTKGQAFNAAHVSVKPARAAPNHFLPDVMPRMQ
jgi:hypothetical protein